MHRKANVLCTESIPAQDRIKEIAEILAVGFLRMLRRTSSDPTAALTAENCLDSRAPKSVHRVEP